MSSSALVNQNPLPSKTLPPGEESTCGPTWRELACVVCGLAALMAVQLLLSGGGYLFVRHFWLDEIYTHTLVTRPLEQSLRALAGGVETHPPTFYLLLRLFTSVFGDSEAALRSFALLSILAALVGIYVSLRQAFSPSASLLATLLVWCHPLVLSHAFEARCYGPWLAGTVWFAYFLARARDGTGGPLNTYLVAASSVFVCTIHYFGIITVALVTGFELWLHRGRGTRWAGLAAVTAGPVSLLLCVPLVLAQRSAITVPTWHSNDLVLVLPFVMALLNPVFLVLLIPWFVHLLRARGDDVRTRTVTALAGLTGLALLPVILIAFSYAVQPAMLDRYGLPAVAAVAPAVAWVASRASRRLVLVFLAACIVFSTVKLRLDALAYQERDRATDRLIDALRKYCPEDPVSFEYPHDLYTICRYAPDIGEHCYYLDFEIGQVGDVPNIRLFTRDLCRNYARFYGRPALLRWEQAKELPRRFLVHNSSFGGPADISGPTDQYPGFVPRHLDEGLFELIPETAGARSVP
jgi:hypothetical protein